MSMFHVGQAVVCVECIEDRGEPDLNYPVVGMVYTVRDIDARPLNGAAAGLLLEEIVNPLRAYAEGFCEPDWDVDAFRPVKRTSIEIFHKLVAPSPKETEAA